MHNLKGLIIKIAENEQAICKMDVSDPQLMTLRVEVKLTSSNVVLQIPGRIYIYVSSWF